MVTERYLATFGYLASLSAKRSNRFSLYELNQRELEMILCSGALMTITRTLIRETMQKLKKLVSMEDAWYESQGEVKKERVKLVAQRQHKSNTFTNSLLGKCKLHGGPVSTEQEVQQISKEKSFLRCELQYHRLTNSKDALLRPQLYKVNGLSP